MDTQVNIVNYQLGSMLPGFSSIADVNQILGKPAGSPKVILQGLIIYEYTNPKFTWARGNTLICSFKDNILDRIVFSPTVEKTRNQILAKKGTPVSTSSRDEETFDVYQDGWCFVYKNNVLTTIIIFKPKQVSTPVRV